MENRALRRNLDLENNKSSRLQSSSWFSSGESSADMEVQSFTPSCSPGPEFRNDQNLSTSSSSSPIACVSFSVLQQPLAMFGQAGSSSAAVVAPALGRSTSCLCSSLSPALPLNSLIPSPFSPSSLSSFFPAHVAQQCSSSSSCCSHSTSVPIPPLIQPRRNRPRPRRTSETAVVTPGTIVKRTASSSPGVVRLSSLASLASAVQAFSHSGKGFVAGRDGDREEAEQVQSGDNAAAGEHQRQQTLLPGIVTATLAAANSSLSRGIACFSEQWPRRLDGFRRHQLGLGATAAARAGAKQRRGLDPFKATAPKGEEAKDTTEKNETTTAKEVNKPKTKAIQTSQHLLAGAIAAMVSRTIVAPLERLKLEYLVRGAQGSVAKTVQTILKNEGLGGFWKGNGMNLLRTAPFKSVNFFCYDTYRNHLLKFGDRKEVTNLERLAAGAAAGVTATILCFPLDTIRTTMVAPGGEALGGMIGCFNHMLRTEGFLSLYKGLLPAVVSMAPSGAVFYGVYDMLKIAYLNSPEGKQMQQARRKRMKDAKERGEEAWVQPELGPVRTLLFGAIAGACAESVTYPFEVVRRAQQLQHAAVKLGMARTFQMLLNKGGVKALYAGLFPSTLQVLPSAAFSYFVYETMKIAFKIP